MKGKVFDAEMVQAILKGDKAQFREPLKKPFEVHPNGYITKPHGNERLVPYEPPYQVGDIIYVKETWKIQSMSNFDKRIKFMFKAEPSGKLKETYVPNERYNALMKYECKNGWQPPLYMPKEAARIFLKIKDIKAQRVQDITEDEVFKEGMVTDELEDMIQGKEDMARGLKQSNVPVFETNYYREAFKNKWDIKYQSRGYEWNKNPWVWCITFEKVEKPLHEEN